MATIKRGIRLYYSKSERQLIFISVRRVDCPSDKGIFKFEFFVPSYPEVDILSTPPHLINIFQQQLIPLKLPEIYIHAPRPSCCCTPSLQVENSFEHLIIFCHLKTGYF